MKVERDSATGAFVLHDDDNTPMAVFSNRKELSKGIYRLSIGEPPCIGCGPKKVSKGESAGHKYRGNQWDKGIPGGGPKEPLRPANRESMLSIAGKQRPAMPTKAPQTPKEADKKKQDAHNESVNANATKIEEAITNARTKVKVKEGVFGDKAVLVEGASKAQIAEAQRLVDAIVKGQQAEVHTGESILVVSMLKQWAITAMDRQKQEKNDNDESTNYKVPDLNLCAMTMPGSNVFCTEDLGLTRDKMPQFKSLPMPGSKAEAYAKAHPELVNEDGELDARALFEADIAKAFPGIKITHGKKVKASTLKATQNELKGVQVLGMATTAIAGTKAGATREEKAAYDAMSEGNPTMTSNDGFILDGHHGNASSIVADIMNDGNLGDVDITTTFFDLPIAQLIVYAQSWALDFGMTAKAGSSSPESAAVNEDKVKNPNLYKSLRKAFLSKGERSGHPFRGNRYTKGKFGNSGLTGKMSGSTKVETLPSDHEHAIRIVKDLATGKKPVLKGVSLERRKAILSLLPAYIDSSNRSD